MNIERVHAGIASLLIQAMEDSATMSAKAQSLPQRDCIVVGAGYGGLAAAVALHKVSYSSLQHSAVLTQVFKSQLTRDTG